MKKQAIFFLMWGSLSFASVSFAATTSSTYSELIQQARNGDYQPALIMLRQYGPSHPADRRAAYDHMLIASWANQSDEVIKVYEGLTPPAPDSLPAHVLTVVAKAYRDTQHWNEALALYREGQRRFPRSPSYSLGEIMTLADAQRTEEAISRGKAMVDSAPSDPDRRIALGYAYQLAHSPYAALSEMSQAHDLAPAKSYVTREYIFALEQAGLANSALTEAKKQASLMSPSEMRRLQGNYAAQLTRLAFVPTRREVDRFAIADRALADYAQWIPEWQKLGPEAHDDVIRIRLDRLLALHARSRMSDVVNEYEALRAQGVTIPHYVLNDVASAYLYLKQPEKAAEIYRQSLENPDGDELDDQAGLFYASIENESFDQANTVMSQAQASQPVWRSIKGKPDKLPNDLHLVVEQAAALGRLYEGDVIGAQDRLEKMVALAPYNTNLRASLATVYGARGWPRRAERQLKLAETLSPRDLKIEIAQGQTAMELQEWRQAELLTQDTLSRFPEDLAAQRLQRIWQVHNKAELRVTGYRGITSNSPVSGNGDFGIDTTLYSPPINDNWRVFGGGGFAEGHFDEGNAYYRWLRTGVEWRSRDITATGEVSSHSYGYGVKPGMRLAGTFDLNDQWQIGASGEIRSRDTPLRALANNISSNSASVFLRWQANDQNEWLLAFTPSHFSDGNNRMELDLTGRKRIYTAPRFSADLGLNVSASHNTVENADYFNPRSDLTVLPTLALTHVLYRRYETVLEHTLTLGAGMYAQQGYNTGAIGSVGYGIRYRTNDVFEIGASVTGISRPYDGQRERDIRILLDMTIRF